MEKWNRNEWQGKRKNQVDYSNFVVFFCLVLLILVLITFGILHFFN